MENSELEKNALKLQAINKLISKFSNYTDLVKNRLRVSKLFKSIDLEANNISTRQLLPTN